MMIVCCMFLTAVASCLFLIEAVKRDCDMAKLIIYTLNILALAYLFGLLG